MAKMVYDESYGEMTFALRTAVRKFNVSPSDYWSLQDQYGATAYAEMTAAIKEFSTGGMFSVFDMWHGHDA